MKKMRCIIIDNYDSFTYNLVHLLRELGTDVVVKHNDDILLEEIDNYDRIVLSPGPGIPSEAGLMPNIIKYYAETKPILGVCLGHQAIAEIFGG
ncbi:MAG: aminodeoxychorismate/anthranilate synthase component II, partial [Prevotella sp.]